MQKKVIVNTKDAPGAIGPYNQAVAAGGLLFVSGQIPLDPGSGEIVKAEIELQTKQVLENLKAIVEAAGCTLIDVVKTTCYLSDMDHFAAMNKVYASYFTQNQPARAAVEVSRLPKDVLIEIDAIVVR